MTGGLLGALALSAVLSPDDDGLRGVIRWLLQPLLIVGLAGWALRSLPLRKVWHGALRLLLAALLGGALVFQHLPAVDAYPFTYWSMYTVPERPVTYTEFLLLDANGESVGHLPIADLVPNTLGRAFMARLTEWVKRAEDGEAQAEAVVEATLRGLIKELDDPDVASIDVRWCHVDAPTRQAPVRCVTAVVVGR